ncbi:FAD-binding oxidoreductase [Celeribacter halophilus]|uniref:FAD/FMN-containing dehydrogenase n=1 Tax=Celeribacter halophilus TaxID=576117 RepID=A0A1I3WEQ4_9RHOB|nr:FAD-binding oxidoreductase [Celeribacter halophilus]MBU2888172.1 FAD-binding oxidoreductase [Celeribacter halophilus]MDO6512139.1 FAD-binding oxidoreductase [Celeribacter halophilus]PZX06788.1 FAD/FMN-containing dehydrogenase [Celeribacter halophilus]SFK05942.1 FAD/FMN-containing dehydrogenase [Celeribacter halophilus]
MTHSNIAAACQALSHLDLDTNPNVLRQKSRDFFWYSPVLKARLDEVCGDFVVSPRNEAEVIEVLRTCYAHDVAVTVRGAGTGNYGQAMPLAGGCVMHMQNMAQIKEISTGRVVVEPGCLLKDIDLACREESGQELRMISSTWSTATIGGYIAGGSGGIGSVHWGSLRDFGNILRIRVITMEKEPRVMDITGADMARVSHAYGTNGIITEIEMPLAPAYEWCDVFLAFDTFEDAMACADDVAHEDGILLKLASVFEAPTAHAYFKRVQPYVSAGTHLVGLMVAPQSMDGFLAFLEANAPSARLIYRSDQSDWARSPGHVFEYSWNHTTLRALKVDPSITYLQIRFAGDEKRAQVETMRRKFEGEVITHLEVTREHGRPIFTGLSMVKFTSEARLDEIVAAHEEIGAMIFNPHRYTLEEGGRQSTDERQLKFKAEADPKGLLNPGKMISWHDPDWTYDEMYSFPDMQQRRSS